MAWCRQAQAITWVIFHPDLCRHLASLGHNELNKDMAIREACVTYLP